MGEMIPVASSQGVTVYCPAEGKFSFFNSLYPAHRLFTGIDVYPERGFGDLTPSPIEGKVTLIRKVKCPRGRGFRDHGYDVVTLLMSTENPDRMIKVLHVEPSVERGEELEPGQELGTLIRSGYYGYATHPHVHVEIREPSDPLRARGGHTIRRLINVTPQKPLDELRGTVTKNLPEYTLVRFEDVRGWGLPGFVGGVPGLLDGGIPYYGWLGAHTEEPPRGNEVRLCGRTIAEISETRDGTCVAKCTNFKFAIDGTSVGLSLYLHPRSRPEVVVVPPRLKGLLIEESSEISITIG
ncbi:MAG: hypothetical protein JSV27_06360 [Candidatus Bathyarchaeota archaeon]|nr:MAG: hypothetical protein JSV27_06360 [Candidatus Bathyarchaeota archaeon]